MLAVPEENGQDGAKDHGGWSQAGGLPGTRAGAPGLIAARATQGLRGSGGAAAGHDGQTPKGTPAELAHEKALGQK